PRRVAAGQFGSWELGILQRPETSQGPLPYCRFHPSMMSARVNPTTLSDSVAPPGVDPGGAQGCSALDALLAMMSACAPDMYAHVRRVSQMATVTARMIELPAPIVEQVEQAALLHDLGKLAFTEQGAPAFGAEGELQAVLVRQHVRIGFD